MKFVYRILLPSRERFVIANTRSEAIREYSLVTGMPADFVKKHCTIKNMGRAENATD